MHTGALRTLEFDRVVEAVTSFALTPLGAEKLARLRPLTDPAAVQTALAHTTEGVRFQAANGGFPLEATDDLDTILAALAIEARPLEPAQTAEAGRFSGVGGTGLSVGRHRQGGSVPSAVVDR